VTNPGSQRSDQEPEPVVVRDKRRVSPHGAAEAAAPSGAQPAQPAAEQPSVDVAELSAALTDAQTQLSERTFDLQRLKAEYDNYRRRVERDREASADQATSRVLGGLLGTLDDIDRAEQHGDLDGAFKAVAESLRSAVANAGLEQFGVKGEPFDPQIHEALVHNYQAGLDGPTCIEVYRSGYRFAGRVLRPAQVVVAEPPEGSVAQPPAGGRVTDQTSDEASADGTA
jgi:molecular chaperone GrpE